jgi:inner membrane protein involved in colicin E2 resistance
MKNIALKTCKWLFAAAFLIGAGAFALQGIEIIHDGTAKGVSLATFLIFSVLNINGIFYSYFIAKDKTLLFGTILNSLGCIFILILKIIY